MLDHRYLDATRNEIRYDSFHSAQFNVHSSCCIGRDGTRFGSECAFIFSDIMVNISQVTPVTILVKII